MHNAGNVSSKSAERPKQCQRQADQQPGEELPHSSRLPHPFSPFTEQARYHKDHKETRKRFHTQCSTKNPRAL